MPRKNVWLWWSSGKDSAWALNTLKKMDDVEVSGLVTTINVTVNRVTMHAVRRDLLEAQAELLDLPLHLVEIPYPCPNEAYEDAALEMIKCAEHENVSHMAFGDLFLEDVRAYRESLLNDSGIECMFPLWKRDTSQLATEIIESGIKAYLTCIDPKTLDPNFVGRSFDDSLLSDLPAGVDPCGENGEFHTFVYESPDFRSPIAVEIGAKVERDGFWFADVCPV